MLVDDNSLAARLSERVLGFVETLPTFQGGPIRRLQSIRQRQREWAQRDLEQRRRPENAELSVRRISVAFNFHYEEFPLLRNGLRRAFGANDEVKKLTAELQHTENQLDSLSSRRVGNFSRKAAVFLTNGIVANDLPPKVSHVQVWYYRLLPSFALLVFDFQLDNELSRTLQSIQQIPHLSRVVFKRFWPPHKLHYAYQMGGEGAARRRLQEAIFEVEGSIISWASKKLKLSKKIAQTASTTRLFELKGYSFGDDSFPTWAGQHHGWLSDFELDPVRNEVLRNSHSLVNQSSSILEKACWSGILVTQHNPEGTFDPVDFYFRDLAIALGFYSLIGNLKTELEHLRALSFKAIRKQGTGIIKAGMDIQSLKTLAIVIKRCVLEMKQNEHWIAHSMANLGEMQTAKGTKSLFSTQVLSNVHFGLDRLQNTLEVVDAGLTSQLDVQNIHVMYKLQRRMLWLTVVVTIATLVGVLAQYDALKTLLHQFLSS